MSYVLTPYLIDLTKLRDAVGSKDVELIETIRRRDPEKFDYVDAPIRRGRRDPSGCLSLGKAVTQLVMGEALDVASRDSHQYGYALESLCNELGVVVLPDFWGGVKWQAMEATNMHAVLGQTGPPVDVPEPAGGFPVIGHLDRNRIHAMVNQMGDEGLTHQEPDLQELLKEFESWLRLAADQDKDVVLFYR